VSRLQRAVVGLRPRPRIFGPVTQTDIVRFAGAGGDFNPLHHDPARAQAAGFEAPIAMVQMTAGVLAGWLTDWCGVENLRSYEVRFTAPVRIGDTVELSGEVVEVTPDGSRSGLGGALARLDLVASVDGSAVVTGRAAVLVSAQ
jgi:3-hydroxybutyryl-CoA dehydratase